MREFTALLLDCERMLREIGYNANAGSLGLISMRRMQAAIKGAKVLDAMSSKRLAGMDEHDFYDEFLIAVKESNTIARGLL